MRATSGPEHQRGGAHGLDQFVFGFGVAEIAATDDGAVGGAAVAELDLRAHGDEQLALGLDVANVGDVFQDELVFGEEGGGHCRESRVFRSADAHCTDERIAAPHYELIHKAPLPP